MMDSLQQAITVTKEAVALGLIVIAGAIAHATTIASVKNEDGKTDFRWLDWIIALPVSVFSGFLFSVAADLMSNDQTFIRLAAGVGAFFGLKGLNRLSEAFLDGIVQRIATKKRDDEQ